jgi:hypothetical protein
MWLFDSVVVSISQSYSHKLRWQSHDSRTVWWSPHYRSRPSLVKTLHAGQNCVSYQVYSYLAWGDFLFPTFSLYTPNKAASAERAESVTKPEPISIFLSPWPLWLIQKQADIHDGPSLISGLMLQLPGKFLPFIDLDLRG